MEPVEAQARTRPGPGSLDRSLYHAIHGLPHTQLGDRYIAVVSDLGEGLGWVAAGIAMPARLPWGPPSHAIALAFVGREILVVGIRPADASFPSGHTASSFAAATALSTFYPNVVPLVFGLATLVGASRVHLGHHFPSDAAVGALIGIGTGTFTGWLLKLPKFL